MARSGLMILTLRRELAPWRTAAPGPRGRLGEVDDGAAVVEVDDHRRLVGQRVADELANTGTVRETERRIMPMCRGSEVSRVPVQPPSSAAYTAPKRQRR